MKEVKSIIIINNGLGFVAELRFKDSSNDCSLSGESYEAIHKSINRELFPKEEN